MTEIVNAVGISREALYKALRTDAQPRFETIIKVCKVLGVKLTA
ncbi:addiction module antidote protein [Methylomonas sp. UP202]|nr:addiction module antidote protein [Methylomonas sp. UP202]WGS86330.1 putative addiction module antidote protein [Methylomonas sp. UP202]